MQVLLTTLHITSNFYDVIYNYHPHTCVCIYHNCNGSADKATIGLAVIIVAGEYAGTILFRSHAHTHNNNFIVHIRVRIVCVQLYNILHYVHIGDCYGQNSTIDSTDIQVLEQSITHTHTGSKYMKIYLPLATNPKSKRQPSHCLLMHLIQW